MNPNMFGVLGPGFLNQLPTVPSITLKTGSLKFSSAPTQPEDVRS